MADTASDIAKVSIMGAAMVLAIAGNILVAYVLIKRWKALLENRPTYQFILNLVLSDLVFAILLSPFEFVQRITGTWMFGTALCKIVDFVEMSTYGTAVISHTLIAVDRYRSLAHPYLLKIKPKRVKQLIALSWIVPAVVTTPYLYMFTVVHVNSNQMCTTLAIPVPWLDKLYEAVEFGVLYFTPFCVICWCYYHVIRLTLGRQPHDSGAQIPTAEISLRRSKRRVTKTACLIVVAFVVCWSPTFVLSIWRIASGTESVHHGHTLYEVSFYGTFINEAINPIIYSAFDRNMNVCAYIYCGHRIFNRTSEAESIRTNERIDNRASVVTRELRFAEPS